MKIEEIREEQPPRRGRPIIWKRVIVWRKHEPLPENARVVEPDTKLHDWERQS